MQYLTPTCHLLLGLLAYGEAFTPAHTVTFACIWSALIVFSYDAIRTAKTNRRPSDSTAP
ncbi:hypothetical protein CCP1ISM_5390002 [Azospirillaceae bacterium]